MFRRPTRQNVRRSRGGIFAATVIGMLAVSAPTAQASFHEILVREVYAGGAANDSYVVLQAYSSGQKFVEGHSVTAYDAAGNQIGSFTFGGSVANSQSQMTILVADTAYATTFPSPTYPNPPDGSMSTLNLSPNGGAVCWAGLDCVAWGNFSGTISPSPGPPAASPGGIPSSMALRRTITGGNCSNQLDPGDDSDDSEADFTIQTPHPRKNVPTIEEGVSCTPPQLPAAEIDSGPDDPTKETEASFTYHSNPAGAEFECSLDSVSSFTSCGSGGISYPGPLLGGNHTFRVRAKNANGTGSPASYPWKVDFTSPTMTITEVPPNPSPGNSVLFRFQANEAVSSIECSLAKDPEPEAFSKCSSPKTYTNLEDGSYTFEVRAKEDLAGNQGSPASFPWTVNNELNDEMPPETTIVSKPPDPSSSSTATFTYKSNEEGSTFECKLDSGPFVGCEATGVTYFGLANGPHSFQVRARDSSDNIDESPAGYSWDVAFVTIEPPPLLPPPLPEIASDSPRAQPPRTILTAQPRALTRDRTPTFRFRSSLAGSSFGCKVDRGAFRPCSSPFTTKTLSFGAHAVQIRAVAGGLADPSPAKSSFRVAKPKRKKAGR